LPTSLFSNGAGPTQLTGFGNNGGTGKLVITATNGNGVNTIGSEINLSPESFYFADSHTLYVADAGISKNDSALNDSNGSALGDGGLQKWIYSDSTKSWSLAYTISAGLDLVANTSSAGVTGLLGLTGQVVNGQVQLFATSYTIGDLDQSFLYGVSDALTATSGAGTSFTTLAAAPADSNFKGVAFAPNADSTVPEPATWAMMVVGFGVAGAALRRRTRAIA
jgi:hypothetical protein